MSERMSDNPQGAAQATGRGWLVSSTLDDRDGFFRITYTITGPCSTRAEALEAHYRGGTTDER